MALWGNNDNVSVGSGATIYISSYTKNETNGGYPVVGAGTSFGLTGCASVGDVIRFGDATKYYGDATIVTIGSSEACYIASTEGLTSTLGTAVTTFTVSTLPKYIIGDSTYDQDNTDTDNYVYGVASGGVTSAEGGQYETGAGWVGVQTYVDQHGSLRVKKEVLVAMSGITTGDRLPFPAYPNVGNQA